MSTQFIHGLENYPKAANGSAIVTLGTFDGIHRGHQAIFDQVRTEAEERGLTPVMVTFHPHPRMVTTPNDVPMLLTTIEEKEKFVPCFFDGKVLVLEFNQALRNMSAAEFVKKILIDTVGMKHLVVGYDHALGKNRDGDTSTLESLGEEHGFSIEIVDPVIHNDAPISSTRVRDALTFGKYAFAVELLGHDYAIYGRVEQGIGLGRKLGYPTANLRYSHRKLLPPEGVYACYALIGEQKYPGMMFVGQNHFNPVARLSVEANLFDFDRDIYGEEVILYPTNYIRENRRYESKEALVEQIKLDKQQVLEIMKQGEHECQ